MRRRLVFLLIALLLLVLAMISRFVADFTETHDQHLLWGRGLLARCKLASGRCHPSVHHRQRGRVVSSRAILIQFDRDLAERLGTTITGQRA